MVWGATRKNVTPLVKLCGCVIVLFTGLTGFFVLTVVPSCSHCPETTEHLPTGRLRQHVEKLSVELAPRNYKRIWNLDKCADYIAGHFQQAGGVLSEQTYEVEGKTYRNVIASFGIENGARIVVGAHYDAYRDAPGADDNASAVAGLIELAYLLGHSALGQRIDLVAFTLEEPPFFRSGNMGSARHAYGLRKNGVEVEAMIFLEMIGYFNDEKGSQRFPSGFLKWCYPDSGNYIAVIGSLGDRKLARTIKASMRGATDLPAHAMCAAKGFPGLDFSDHLNYWNQGYPAIMVTDTAFMRNLAYHGPNDTPDRLDYDRMAKVVLGVYEAAARLANDLD
jgi:hypothetical protein